MTIWREGAEAPPAPPKKKTDEQVALEVLELALQFEAKLKEKLPEVALLLGSQSTSDVTAAMDAVVTAHSFDLEGARPAAILTLVFSKEPTIKERALTAAQSVWLKMGSAPGRADAGGNRWDATPTPGRADGGGNRWDA